MQLSKYDAQAICDDLKEIVKFDINYINSSGIMIASTRHERIGIHHPAALKSIETKQKVIINKEDENDIYLEGINAPVVVDEIVIGVISINGEVSVVENYIDIITKMTQIYINGLAYEKTKNKEQLQKKKIIENLMFSQNLETINTELQKYSIKISNGCYMIVIELVNEQIIIQDIFKHITEELLITLVGNQLIGIIVAPNKEDAEQLINKTIIPKLPKSLYKIGIGTRSNTIETLYLSYKNAISATKAIKLYSKDILFYEDISYEIVLSTLVESVRKDVLDKTFSKFSAEKKNDYYTILKIFFESNRSLEITSKTLFIHKNTIIYRLDKINKITGYNPRKFTDASFLYLALLIYEQEIN